MSQGVRVNQNALETVRPTFVHLHPSVKSIESCSSVFMAYGCIRKKMTCFFINDPFSYRDDYTYTLIMIEAIIVFCCDVLCELC